MNSWAQPFGDKGLGPFFYNAYITAVDKNIPNKYNKQSSYLVLRSKAWHENGRFEFNSV